MFVGQLNETKPVMFESRTIYTEKTAIVMSDISRDAYLRCQRKFKMQGTLKFLPFLKRMNVRM